MPVFELVETPYCRVVTFAAWNAPRHRHFVAYEARGGYRWLLGHATVDEFATFSSPIFLAPAPFLGKVYDAGITLGHRRDASMDLDFGWPPLCAGLAAAPAPAELPDDWQERLLAALAEGGSADAVASRRAAGHELSRVTVGEVTVVATDAPLLPRQLRRLAEAAPDAADTGLVIAVATGNRIVRQEEARPLRVRGVSQARLDEILTAARQSDGLR